MNTIVTCLNRDPDVKQHFRTPEGIYKLEYATKLSQNSINHKVLKLPLPKLTLLPINTSTGVKHKIIYNFTRDLYVLDLADLQKLDDEKLTQGRHTFKDRCPTCYDVNLFTRSNGFLQLLIGTTDGQVFLVNAIKWDFVKIYNEDYCIEPNDSCVTGVKWVPGSETDFVVAYTSGNMYTFTTAHYTRTPSANIEYTLNFTLTKQGDSFNILAYRGKSRNKEILKWELRCGVIHEFVFSPDCKHLAIVSQDGFLRVFDYNSQDLVAAMRSYFGGLTCVCWSPDGRYIVTGGEDDLITVWSLSLQRVIARGEGHKSWVTMVSFDPYMHTSPSEENRTGEREREGDRESTDTTVPVYRFGSVGQDTLLFLWELCEDSLEPVTTWRTRNMSIKESTEKQPETNSNKDNANNSYASNTIPRKTSNNTKKLGSNKISDSNNTLPHRNKLSKLRHLVKQSHSDNHLSDSAQFIKNMQCFTILDTVRVPRLYEVPRIDPIVSKRISLERLSCIVFTPNRIIISCIDGIIQTWTRPREPLSKSSSATSLSNHVPE